jgi:hypothetical protein
MDCDDITSDIIHPDVEEIVFRLNNNSRFAFHQQKVERCKAFIRQLFSRFAQHRARMYAARKIQRAWRRCRDNPAYTMCKRVRMRQLEDDNDSIFVRE